MLRIENRIIRRSHSVRKYSMATTFVIKQKGSAVKLMETKTAIDMA